MASQPTHSLVGTLLEYLREASGLRISDLCREARISTKTYEKLKKRIRPSGQTLHPLLRAVQAPPSPRTGRPRQRSCRTLGGGKKREVVAVKE